MIHLAVTKQSLLSTGKRITALALIWCLWSCLQPVCGQPQTFGSADDPREQIRSVWWKNENTLNVMGGLSLLGAQWRTAASVTASLVSRSFTARFNGTARVGVYGLFDRDYDEAYDVLRTVEFIRYNPPPRVPLYLRVGPISRLRLGTGHLVNFYNTEVAWDERTVGTELMYDHPFITLTAFTSNVLLNGPTGARVAITPLYLMSDPQTRTFTIGLSYVNDLGTRRGLSPTLDAYSVDLSFDALSSGDIELSPFASFAWYRHHGSGLGIGASLESANFIDLARFSVRMALFYNGQDFIPGYFSSFYAVDNTRARIIESERYFTEGGRDRLEGVPLSEALGGNDLITELRILIFERFELWYFFRRHYGTQNLSEYHLRLFLQVPNRLSVDVGIDRGGLSGFFSLFSTLGDQTALVFDTDYRIFNAFWMHLQARYSFEQLEKGEDGTSRYLVQRRFEPYLGIQFTF